MTSRVGAARARVSLRAHEQRVGDGGNNLPPSTRAAGFRSDLGARGDPDPRSFDERTGRRCGRGRNAGCPRRGNASGPTSRARRSGYALREWWARWRQGRACRARGETTPVGAVTPKVSRESPGGGGGVGAGAGGSERPDAFRPGRLVTARTLGLNGCGARGVCCLLRWGRLVLPGVRASRADRSSRTVPAAFKSDGSEITPSFSLVLFVRRTGSSAISCPALDLSVGHGCSEGADEAWCERPCSSSLGGLSGKRDT